MGKKLSDLTKVTTASDTTLFYLVDPARAEGDQSVGMDKDDVQTLVGGSGGGAAPVSKTGTTIVFTEDAFYNKDTYLTSGDITFDVTDAVLGATIILYLDRYVPNFLGEDYLLSGTISASKLNLLYCTWDGNTIQATNTQKSYLSTPSFTVTSGNATNDLSGFAVSGADSYSIKFNTVDNEGTASDVPSYNGTDTTYTHTGLTNGQVYYYYIIASGNSFLSSSTGTNNGTPISNFTFNVQSADSSFTLPLVSTGDYDFAIYLDDVFVSNITAWDDAAKAISLGDTLSHEIELVGTCYGWQFANNSEAPKIRDVSSWGTLRLSNSTTTSQQFRGCSNLTVSATDALDLTGTTSGLYMFANCTVLSTLPSIADWDFTNFTTLQYMFSAADAFNQDLSGLVTSGLCTNYSYMFQGADVFNGSLTGLNLTNATTLNRMFNGADAFNNSLNWSQTGNVSDFGLMFNSADVFDQDISAIDVGGTGGVIGNFIINTTSFSTANYDLFLVSLEAQVAAAGGTLDNGSVNINSFYTSAGAGGTARASLVGTYGWSFGDRGGI